jgi:protein-S-isoprenylcysteine O-methyltransferase Ste14
MYTALLLLAAGCALSVASLAAWVLWLALAGVLTIKATLEEAWMTREHPDYAGYRARTRRFLPWLL